MWSVSFWGQDFTCLTCYPSYRTRVSACRLLGGSEFARLGVSWQRCESRHGAVFYFYLLPATRSCGAGYSDPRLASNQTVCLCKLLTQISLTHEVIAPLGTYIYISLSKYCFSPSSVMILQRGIHNSIDYVRVFACVQHVVCVCACASVRELISLKLAPLLGQKQASTRARTHTLTHLPTLAMLLANVHERAKKKTSLPGD